MMVHNEQIPTESKGCYFCIKHTAYFLDDLISIQMILMESFIVLRFGIMIG